MSKIDEISPAEMQRAFETLLRVVDKTISNAEEFTSSGRPFPPWLEKKLKAVELLKTDFIAGLDLLIDGCHDYIQALEDAEYHVSGNL